MYAVMSADEKESTVTKEIENGVVCFILKPISQDDVRDLWKYAIKRKKTMNIGKSVIEVQENANEKSPHEVIVAESSSSVNEESNKKGKSGKKNERDKNQDNFSTTSKKSKLVWTDFLHNRFLEAVTKLGLAKAYPRRILALMDIPELTKGNVASHLQKYRHYLKKVTTPVNSNPQLISNLSEISFDNVNQLYTRKAVNNVSTHQLLNDAATSNQQLMIGNLNDVADVETDLQRTDQMKKQFSDMLAFYSSQKHHNIKFENMKTSDLSIGDITQEASIQLPPLPEHFVSTGVGPEEGDTALIDFSMLDNSYPTPNSTVHSTSVFDSQFKVQSSNMVKYNIEEGTNLNFIDGNNDPYQQVCLTWADHILPEQENYGEISTEDISFQFCNAPLNLELEQGNYRGVATEESTFHLHYVSPEFKS
ncbi:hypothetical protein BC332_08138 [Capsicum chinense]|nr:hypothetical protein BC332_08138 [Capsicum chinense]